MPKSTSFVCFGPEDDQRIPNEPIGKYLFDCLKRKQPNDIVNIDGVTGNALTSHELIIQIIQASAVFKSLGIKKGDIIVIASENTLNYCAFTLAALCMGIISHHLNPSYSIFELNHALLISKPKVILCSESALANIIAMKKEFDFIEKVLIVGPRSENHSDIGRLEDVMSSMDKEDAEHYQPDVTITMDDGAFILMSSGTSGLPKGVFLNHKNLRGSIGYLSDPHYGNCTKDDTSIFVPPLFHIFGIIIQLIAIYSGMKLVVLSKFKPETFLGAIEKYEATKLFVVPPLLIFLQKSPLVKNYNITCIKDIIVGGAPVGMELQQEIMTSLNITVRQIYGSTELSGACTFETLRTKKYDGGGFLVPGTSAKVVDIDSKINVEPFKIGEMCFKGDIVMQEYFGNTEESHDSIDNDGFYHTGDLGYYNEEEKFYVVGRLKELIKYKGFQVPPAEIEKLILTHPGVKDCAVIGIPDERAGELTFAYIVPQSQITEQDIIQFVAERISPQKRLYGGCTFCEEIPKTPTGKILRHKLLDMYKALH